MLLGNWKNISHLDGSPPPLFKIDETDCLDGPQALMLNLNELGKDCYLSCNGVQPTIPSALKGNGNSRANKAEGLEMEY